MKMPQSDPGSLWGALTAGSQPPANHLRGADVSVPLAELVSGSILGGRLAELRGRSILLATRDQLTTALAMIELDGIAQRLVLCPPDLPLGHLPSVITTAAVDAVVSDRVAPELGIADLGCFLTCNTRTVPANSERNPHYRTEWVLLTSGTTGLPKMALHTLSSLAGAIKGDLNLGSPIVWSTFYDIRRYGGLQIFLRAVFGGASLVLSSAQESTEDFLIRAGMCGVTHISGTPSHWRRALMSPLAPEISPQYVRLSGEIADQAILDKLRATYKEARIVHAFASTEAGVGFEVDDDLAGFPARMIALRSGDVELKIEDGSLRVRSAGTAIGYLGSEAERLADDDGFVDTGDIVELRDDRFYFVGRRDGTINVGGLKVHPEEVEAVINRHPSVQMSLVKGRKNQITGAIVVADVVVKSQPNESAAIVGSEALKSQIIDHCRLTLPPYKVPAAIRFVTSLDVAAFGKLVRRSA